MLLKDIGSVHGGVCCLYLCVIKQKSIILEKTRVLQVKEAEPLGRCRVL